MPDEIPVREHLERLLQVSQEVNEAKFVTFRALVDSNSEKVALALAAADKAVSKAELAAEKRFESVNEFRGQLTDQAATFITRREHEQTKEAFQAEIKNLTGQLDKLAGRAAGQAQLLAGAVAFITVVVIVANAYFK